MSDLKPVPFLEIHRGDAPLIVSFPHTGVEIPNAIEEHTVSAWLSRKDADYWVHLLYDFARELGATTLRTTISRTVIDVNRDPSGVSLYPGQTTTGLCPIETFDGEALYLLEREPDVAEIARRRVTFFDPYHAALRTEIERLAAAHARVVLYDAHSIRSVAPRLFKGTLPHLNIGTFDGKSCAPALAGAIEAICDRVAPTFSRVTNGRFKGGWTTRHYGQPERGVHAVQMELACRGYLREPDAPLTAANWPAAYDAAHAAPMRAVLTDILGACLGFANEP
ncbi:MAG TPA: N-formylglutamate deformylase [Polyangiales bacterium]|nr:N-formylglutamate deformylase [Polyangiales bacterium]